MSRGVGLLLLAAALLSCRGGGCSNAGHSGQEEPGEVNVSMEIRGDVASLPASYSGLHRALRWARVPSWNQAMLRAAAVVPNGATGAPEVIVVRVGRAPEGKREEPQSIEVARIEPASEGAPSWRVVGRLLAPVRPSLGVGPEGAVRCVLTGIPLGEDPSNAPRRVFAFDPRAGEPALFDPGFGEALEEAPQVSLDEQQRLWILGQPWHPPIQDTVWWPLRVSATKTSAHAAFSQDVANTDKPLSVRRDYTLFAGATETHVVFAAESRAEGQRPELHHFHDVLDAGGRTLKRSDLGVIDPGRRLVSLFAGPDGKLYLLSITHSGDRIDAHEIKDTGAKVGRRGSREQYFVDSYFGLHVVWFEGEQPKYAGPTRLHGHGVFH